MSIDLSQLNVEQLESLVREAKSEIARAQSEKIVEAKKQIQEIARSVGLIVKFEKADQDAGNKPAKVKKPAPVKYRHPTDASLVWSGRGRQPLWVGAQLADGKSLVDLAV